MSAPLTVSALAGIQTSKVSLLACGNWMGGFLGDWTSQQYFNGAFTGWQYSEHYLSFSESCGDGHIGKACHLVGLKSNHANKIYDYMITFEEEVGSCRSAVIFHWSVAKDKMGMGPSLGYDPNYLHNFPLFTFSWGWIGGVSYALQTSLNGAFWPIFSRVPLSKSGLHKVMFSPFATDSDILALV